MKINIRKGTLPIPIPQPVGGIMGLSKFSRDVIRALVALKNRQDSVQVPRRGGGGGNRHYDVKLLTTGSEGAPIYDVTVTEGWVSETLPGPNDALEYHEADNHREEVDPATDPVTYTDVLRKFTLTVGQAVYVDVKILPTGQVGGVSPSVTIAIDDDNESSAHYRPRVDNETYLHPRASRYPLNHVRHRWYRCNDEGME